MSARTSPTATVYNFVKGVYNGQKAALVKGHPSFRAHVPKLMAKQYTTAKYHPGAIKFYKEARDLAGQVTPDERPAPASSPLSVRRNRELRGTRTTV